MSQLSRNLLAAEFERHESILRHSIESAKAMLVCHTVSLRHGIDVSDLVSEHKVLLHVFS